MLQNKHSKILERNIQPIYEELLYLNLEKNQFIFFYNKLFQQIIDDYMWPKF